MKFIYKKIQKEKVFLIGEFGYFKNLCVRILNFKRDIVPYKLDDFDSCNYYDNRIISRKVVEDYFKYMENGEAEKQLLLDYVKRTICYEYEELHAYINFIKSRNNKIVHFYSKRILKYKGIQLIHSTWRTTQKIVTILIVTRVFLHL